VRPQVGPPQPNLLEGMRRDHCKSEDSIVPFSASNYGTRTQSRCVCSVAPTLPGCRERLPLTAVVCTLTAIVCASVGLVCAVHQSSGGLCFPRRTG
jgi:hypothetical protein